MNKTLLLITFLLIACGEPANTIDLIGKWEEVSSRRMLDGVEVTIPTEQVFASEACQPYLSFDSGSMLELANCEIRWTDSISTAKLIPVIAQYSYTLKDSLIHFDTRQFKILTWNNTEMTLMEQVDTLEEVRVYRKAVKH